LPLQYVKVRVKVKFRPQTGHKGPEGEKRYSSNLSLSSVLDAGGRSTTRPAALTPGKNQNPLYRRLCASGLFLTGAKYLAPTRIPTPDFPAHIESL